MIPTVNYLIKPEFYDKFLTWETPFLGTEKEIEKWRNKCIVYQMFSQLEINN